MSSASTISEAKMNKKFSSAFTDTTHSAPNEETDFLVGLERQMKILWSQYVRCLEQGDSNDAAKNLRNEYYSLYRCYRKNKLWKKEVDNNSAISIRA